MINKSAIIAEYNKLVNQNDSDKLLNPLEETKTGFLLYGKFNIEKNEVKDLAKILAEILGYDDKF